MDYSGRPIGPVRLSRAMNVNILGGACVMAAIAVLWPNAAVTVVFLQESLGASKTLIGLNFTLVGVATAFALPGAWVFSGFRRRRLPWIIAMTTARTLMFGPAIVALLSYRADLHRELVWLFMICLLLVQAGGTLASPTWWAWMADLIPPSMWGRFFGRRYRWLLLSQSISAVLAGRLLDMAPDPATERLIFAGVFGVAALLAVIDPLLFAFVPEPVRPAPTKLNLAATARAYWRPVRNRGFLLFVVTAGLYMFFFNMPFVFLPLFLRGQEIDGHWIGGRASVGLLTLVMVVFAVSTALTANQWGRLADRIGHRVVWILSSLAFFVHGSYFFINEQNFAWIALLNAAVFGAGFAGHQVAAQNLALSMSPARHREFYTSMFLAVVNVVGAFGPLLGGWLADRFMIVPDVLLPGGQVLSYVHLLLVAAFAGMLANLALMVRVPDERGMTVWPWFGRMLSGDLLRVAWNISVLGTALGVPRRVRAIRRISRRDGNIMLPEIVAALDDSDMTLRREALLALGRLGTPEAQDLLRWYVYDPDAAVRAQSVQALAEVSGADRTNLLRQALQDTDSRVRRAAVDALARLGDQASAGELRTMLTGERDGEVLAAVAVALSRLREFGAVREMVDLALRSDNGTVRSQMLVGLADLLGEHSDFHILWRRDRHWRGSSFVRLARKLRKQARLVPRTEVARGRPNRAERYELLRSLNAGIETFLEDIQQERWRSALAGLREMSVKFLRLRYGYQGDDAHALEFVSAVSPALAQRYWMVTYLQHNCEAGTCTDAPWDGLTLLAIYALVHGHPAG